MSETQTLGPCTECGTPRDACTAPDYCCDECLHFPPDWDGYAQPEPARPVGDVPVEEELYRDVLSAIEEHERMWGEDASPHGYADAVLALLRERGVL